MKLRALCASLLLCTLPFNSVYAQKRIMDRALAVPSISLEAAQNKSAPLPAEVPSDFFTESPLSSVAENVIHEHSETTFDQYEVSDGLTQDVNTVPVAAVTVPTYSKWNSTTVTWGIDYASVEQYLSTSTTTAAEHKKAGFFQSIKQAFTQWAQYVALAFQEVVSTSADIVLKVLGGVEFDTSLGGPNTAVAYAYYPQIGDVYLDGGRNYNLPALSTGGVSYNAIGGGLDLTTIFIHEIGHSLGVGHADTDSTSVMYPYLGNQTTIKPADSAVPAIQSLYGAGTGTVKTLEAPPSDFKGITDGAVLSGVVDIGPNLSVHPGIRKVFYYLNGTQSGKYYTAPFTWGGPGGFDTRTLANGNYTLAMSYTDSTGDHASSVIFSVNNTAATVQPKLIGIAAGATVNGTIQIGPDLSTFGTIQRAEYFVDGISRSVSTVSPFIWGGSQGFDTKTLTNANHTLRAVITDNTGVREINLNFNINNPVLPLPPSPPSNDFVGISEGATVSGVINAGPNLLAHPGIRKVSYYLNGTKSGKYYAAPFTWGGISGFDTRTLVNGNHTLSLTYTDSTGDHTVSVNFRVNNV